MILFTPSQTNHLFMVTGLYHWLLLFIQPLTSNTVSVSWPMNGHKYHTHLCTHICSDDSYCFTLLYFTLLGALTTDI